MAVYWPPVNIKKGHNLTYKGSPERVIYYSLNDLQGPQKNSEIKKWILRPV